MRKWTEYFLVVAAALIQSVHTSGIYNELKMDVANILTSSEQPVIHSCPEHDVSICVMEKGSDGQDVHFVTSGGKNWASIIANDFLPNLSYEVLNVLHYKKVKNETLLYCAIGRYCKIRFANETSPGVKIFYIEDQSQDTAKDIDTILQHEVNQSLLISKLISELELCKNKSYEALESCNTYLPEVSATIQNNEMHVTTNLGLSSVALILIGVTILLQSITIGCQLCSQCCSNKNAVLPFK